MALKRGKLVVYLSICAMTLLVTLLLIVFDIPSGLLTHSHVPMDTSLTQRQMRLQIDTVDARRVKRISRYLRCISLRRISVGKLKYMVNKKAMKGEQISLKALSDKVALPLVNMNSVGSACRKYKTELLPDTIYILESNGDIVSKKVELQNGLSPGSKPSKPIPISSTTLLQESANYIPVHGSNENGTLSTSEGTVELNDGTSVDREETDEEIIKKSQNSDIQERGKWQSGQIDKYCRKYHSENISFTLPDSDEFELRENLFRHLLFDDQRELLFCFLPKIGCTNTRRFMLVLQGVIPEDTVHWKSVPEHEYLGPGVRKTNLLQSRLTDAQRVDKLKRYWKFVIVRNPLERLLSAYLNKLSSPMNISTVFMDTFQMHKRMIMEKYHPEQLSGWFKSGGNYNLLLDFPTYIRWIVDTPNHKLNEHFAPMIDLAYPCRVRYNFYGNFKMISSDMGGVVSILNVPDIFYHDKGLHRNGKETKYLLDQYYSQVDEQLKLSLFEDFHQELDFYYHLYPEENNSHIDILGLKKLIQL